MRFCPSPAHPPGCCSTSSCPHQIVNLNLVRKPDWFLAKSASGKVPVLIEPDGWTLIESLVTCDYLEDAHAGAGRCTPATPGRRAAPCAWLLARWATSVHSRLLIDGPCGEETSRKAQLGDSNFFGDCDQVQMADLMIWRLDRAAAGRRKDAGLPACRRTGSTKLLGLDFPDGAAAGLSPSLKAGTGSSRGKNVLMETAPNTWSLGSRSRQLKPNLLNSVLHAVLPVRPAHRLVLQHKQLPHQIVNLNLVRKHRLVPWPSRPSGKVPALQEPDGSRNSPRVRLCIQATPTSERRWNGVIASDGEKVIPAFYDCSELAAMKRRRHSSELVTPSSSRCSPTLGDSKFFAGSESVQMADEPHDLAMVRAPEAFVLAGWLPGMEQQRAVLETRNTDEAHVEFNAASLLAKPAEIPMATESEIF
uniref:GST N-terminal domain-containing protein n=1 Tax=Macrostomum lignano TaxID=282301 RepID=A0A1I8FJ95_9PLAT